MMDAPRKHVLLWVSSDFIESEGIIQIMKEAGLFPASEKEDEKLLESAEEISGFALTGWLVELHHGAGIWIAPKNSPELEMMIPWSMIRTVITAEEKEDRIFGLASAAEQNFRARRTELQSKAD